MLEFTTELLIRKQNGAEHVGGPAPRGLVRRSPEERRTTATMKGTAPAAPRRRRNDALHVTQPAPLHW
jgi:hypothetical protein